MCAIQIDGNDAGESDEHKDSRYFLTKINQKELLGGRENGQPLKYFDNEDSGLIQSNVLLQDLSTKEFKRGTPGSENTKWTSYIASGSASFNFKGIVGSTITWNTNTDTNDPNRHIENEKAWAQAFKSGWAESTLFLIDFRGFSAGDKGTDANPNYTFEGLFFVDWKNSVLLNSGDDDNASLFNGLLTDKEKSLETLDKIIAGSFSAINYPGEDDTILIDRYAYHDAGVSPGSILDAINRIIGSQEVYDKGGASFYSVDQNFENFKNSFEAALGRIVSNEQRGHVYVHKETGDIYYTDTRYGEPPPEGASDEDYDISPYKFPIFNEFQQNIFGKIKAGDTIISGIQYVNDLVKNKSLLSLIDTPTGYIGHSGDYLIVNDGETDIHFTGIEKIAQDLTDYGFVGGEGSTNFTGLLDTPSDYNNGYYLRSTENGIEYAEPAELGKDVLTNATGLASGYLRIDDDGTGIVFVDRETFKEEIDLQSDFTGLLDTPNNYSDGDYLRSTAGGLEYVAASGLAQDISNEIVNNIVTGDLLGFTGLNDTPTAYEAGKFIRVNSAGDAVEYSDISFLNNVIDAPESQLVSGYLQLDKNGKLVWSPATTDGDVSYTITGATHFTGLLDTPTGYTHNAYIQVDGDSKSLQYVGINKVASDLEGIGVINQPQYFTGLNDTPGEYDNGKFLVSTENGLVFTDIPEPVVTFTGLSDTPSDFTAGKYLRVNDAGDALEYVDIEGGSVITSYIDSVVTKTENGPIDKRSTDTTASSTNYYRVPVESLRFDDLEVGATYRINVSALGYHGSNDLGANLAIHNRASSFSSDINMDGANLTTYNNNGGDPDPAIIAIASAGNDTTTYGETVSQTKIFEATGTHLDVLAGSISSNSFFKNIIIQLEKIIVGGSGGNYEFCRSAFSSNSVIGHTNSYLDLDPNQLTTNSQDWTHTDTNLNVVGIKIPEDGLYNLNFHIAAHISSSAFSHWMNNIAFFEGHLYCVKPDGTTNILLLKQDSKNSGNGTRISVDIAQDNEYLEAGDFLYIKSRVWDSTASSITFPVGGESFFSISKAGSGGGGSAGETTFTGLSDTPSDFTAGKYLRVNDAGDALEYVDIEGGGGGSIILPSGSILQKVSKDVGTVSNVAGVGTKFAELDITPKAADSILICSINFTFSESQNGSRQLGAFYINDDTRADVQSLGVWDFATAQDNGNRHTISLVAEFDAIDTSIKTIDNRLTLDQTNPASYRSVYITVEEIAQSDYTLAGGGGGSSTFAGLNDTPSGYLGHSGNYMIVNDGESGIHFTGIEKIAADLTDYGFGGGSSDIPKYTDLPDPTSNDGKIVASGCDLYYGCGGEWKKVGTDAIPPPENVPGCVSNLEEYNQYQEYKEQFLAENSATAFDQMLNSNNDISELIYDVCLFSDNNLSSVKIDETTYKWGMFANTQTVNITATPGVASDREIQFSHWAGDGAVFGDANSSQTTLLVDKDLSVTGYFSEILEGTCEDVALHVQSNTTDGDVTFTDLSSNTHTITRFGDTQHSTTNAYLGSTSMTFDGAGDYLTLEDHEDFSFQQPFTIEMWVYLNSFDTEGVVFIHKQSGASPGGFEFWAKTDGTVAFNENTSTHTFASDPGIFATGGWKHVALSHTGSVAKIFIDGIQVASNTTTIFPDDVTGPIRIGGWAGNGFYSFNGYMQDIRITKKAIYTTNFTPPNSLLNNPC